MSHYDYVKLPNGVKRKIRSIADIESVQEEWNSYIENNWISPQQKMFDPESRVKFMLEGLANIILRPDMSGLLTEYQKMKIDKYEIPLSSCASIIDDELYSKRAKVDNGEEQAKLELYMDEAARKYDEAKAAKTKKEPKRKPPSAVMTRRKKIENARSQFSVKSFMFVRVDTDNVFYYHGKYYRIPLENEKYAPKTLRNGDQIYDMDQILCAETIDGQTLFFDMDIDPVDNVELK